jgi:Bacterial regulatory helix-turn-helix protein, lysR family
MELGAVVAIARLGSFRAAAVDLEVSPTAIGNAIASLENRHGVTFSSINFEVEISTFVGVTQFESKARYWPPDLRLDRAAFAPALDE